MSAADARGDFSLDTRARWWLLAVLFFTAIFSYSDRLILSVLVDPLREQFNLSDSMIGLLQGPAFTLVYVCAALPLGNLADRTRRKYLLFAGASLWCAATVLCGLAPNAGTLVAGRLLLGVGEATLVPAAVSMVADAFPVERRGLALGIFILSTIVGGPFGITLGGMLLSAAQAGHFARWFFLGSLAPWRAVLVFVGFAGVLAPVLILTVTEPFRRAAREKNFRDAARYFFADRRRLVPIYAALALNAVGDYGLVSWVPAVLSRRYDWPSDRVGVAFGLVSAASGVAGSLLGGWLTDAAARRSGSGGRLTISVIGAMFTVLAAAVVSGGTSTLTLTGLGLWIFAAAVASVSAVALIQELVPAQFRATGMAFLTFSNTLIGLGCGPMLIGLATEYVYRRPKAVDLAITTVGVVVASSACALFNASRKRLRAASAQPISSVVKTTLSEVS